MKPYILCIDRGTTAIKAVLFDQSARQRAVASQPCPPLNKPHPGWCEQDLGAVWEAVVLAVKKLLGQGYDPAEIQAISMSGMGNGLNLLDSNGAPTRPCITSLDSRAVRITDAWLEDERIAQCLRRTGSGSIVPCTPMAILRWVQLNEPEVYARSAHVIYSKDWVRYCLTGVIATDKTDTSGSLLLDLSTGEYMHDLFALLGIEKLSEMLPTPLNSYEIAGTVTESAAAQTGLCAGTPVYAGAHDIAACSFGCGGMNAGHLALIFGTVGLSLGVLERKRAHYGLSICSVLPDRWLFSACIQGAGSVLNWFIENFFSGERERAQKQGRDVFELIDEELLRRRPVSILCHPYLFGKNEPAFARGGLYGIAAWHDKYDVLLGLYQGIVYAFLEENMAYLLNNDMREIWLVGGGSKSRVFGQIFADVLGRQVGIPAFSEATGRGAALCALVGTLSEHEREKLVCDIACDRMYSPKPDHHAWYMEQFQLYQSLERQMVPLWKAQHEIEEQRQGKESIQ